VGKILFITALIMCFIAGPVGSVSAGWLILDYSRGGLDRGLGNDGLVGYGNLTTTASGITAAAGPTGT